MSSTEVKTYRKKERKKSDWLGCINCRSVPPNKFNPLITSIGLNTLYKGEFSFPAENNVKIYVQTIFMIIFTTMSFEELEQVLKPTFVPSDQFISTI